MQRASLKRVQGNTPGENSLGDGSSRGGDSSLASSVTAPESVASLDGTLHNNKSSKAGFLKISSQVLAHTNRESFQREEDVGRGLIHPRDPRYKSFWFFCMGIAVWSALADPYDAAFNQGGGFGAKEPFWIASAVITTSVFYIDIVLKFNLGFVDPDTGVIEWSRKVIAWNYIKDKFWLDVLFTFPFTSVIVFCMGGVTSADTVTLVKINILQFLRAGRLYQLFDMFSIFDHNMVFSQLALVLMRNTTYIFFSCHWFACVLYLIGHLEQLTDNPSWLTRHFDRIEGQPTVVLYIYSVYLSVSAFANVGDNAFYMASPTESIAMILYLLFNIVLGAYILGTITQLVVKGDEHSKVFRDRVTSLNDFSSMNALPVDLASSMRTQLELFYTSNHISDKNALDVFPVAIKRKVLRHLYLEAVRKCYVFNGAKAKFLDVLIGASRVEIFMSDIHVLKNGDHVFDLAIIMDGEVEVVAGSGHRSDLGVGVSSLSSTKSMSSTKSRFGGVSFLGSGNQSASGYRQKNTKDIRGMSATYGELAFFTEGESAEGVWTISVVHTLVLSRTAYLALAGKFPYMANKIFDNLKAKSSEGMLRTLYDGVFGADDASHEDMELMDELLMQAKDEPFQINAMEPKELAHIESYLTPEKQAHLAKLRYINDQIVGYCNSEAQRMSASMLAAASTGDLAKINFLHIQGVSVDTVNYYMRTPLMVAASAGRKEVIKLLLSLGADTQICDNFGGTVMYEAVNKGYEGIVDMLMLHGATLGISRRLELYHLTNCVVTGDNARLKNFLHAGANPDNRCADGRTVLHLAVLVPSILSVRLLVEDADADPDLKDVWGFSPMMEAQRIGAAPVVRYFKEKLEERAKLKAEKESAKDFNKPAHAGSVLAASASQHTLNPLLPSPLPTESSESDSDEDGAYDEGDYPVYVGAYFEMMPEMWPAEEATEEAHLPVPVPVPAPDPAQLERGRVENEDAAAAGIESSRCPSTNEVLPFRSPSRISRASMSPASSPRAIPSSPPPGLMVYTEGAARLDSPVGSLRPSPGPLKSNLSRPMVPLDTVALEAPNSTTPSDV